MMTLEERERRAYADGDVETAALLREAIDGLDEAEHAGYERGYYAGAAAAHEEYDDA